MINFIQRAVGYSLTGFTTEDCLFLCMEWIETGSQHLREILKLLLVIIIIKQTSN